MLSLLYGIMKCILLVLLNVWDCALLHTHRRATEYINLLKGLGGCGHF